MIKLELSCSMCGKEKVAEVPEYATMLTDLCALVQAAGWIPQQNGKSLDTYCCKRCAE